MCRNTVQIPVTNGEFWTIVRFRSVIFFIVTAKFQDNFEKTKIINIKILKKYVILYADTHK